MQHQNNVFIFMMTFNKNIKNISKTCFRSKTKAHSMKSSNSSEISDENQLIEACSDNYTNTLIK